MMKPVTILKRPPRTPAPAAPATPSEKVASEISSLLEACLNKERARLETMYRARHDALLRVISDVLNRSLERLVGVAAKRETENLMDGYVKLSASSASSSATAAVLPPIEHDTVRSTREAFATAFEKVALPRLEESMAQMLKELASVIDTQVDDRLVKPASNVLNVLEGAADSVRAARNDVAELTIDAETADLRVVEQALVSGDLAGALQASVDKSDAVQQRAVSGVLDAEAGSEEAFSSWEPAATHLIRFAALFTLDLSDRTDARLRWLYEVVTLLDDAEEMDAEQEDVAQLRESIEGTIGRLTEFQTNGSRSPSETKHAKLLNRVLKAHLRSSSIFNE